MKITRVTAALLAGIALAGTAVSCTKKDGGKETESAVTESVTVVGDQTPKAVYDKLISEAEKFNGSLGETLPTMITFLTRIPTSGSSPHSTEGVQSWRKIWGSGSTRLKRHSGRSASETVRFMMRSPPLSSEAVWITT